MISHFRYALNPVLFARQRLRFTPDRTQSLVLDLSITRGILNCCRQWGKSTITAAKAVHYALFHHRSLTLVLSPTARQSAEFVRKAAHFLSLLDIRPRGDGDNEISLLLPNSARIIGLPGTEATIRGFSAVSLLLIDEASRVHDDLYRAVSPMLAASLFSNQRPASLWLISTPHGRRGFFYDAFSSLDPSWRRISVTGPECPRLDSQYLEDERRRLGPRLFPQEYLCQFLEPNDSLFHPDSLNRLIRSDIKPLFPNGY
jgi:hypothetical protein